MVNWTAQRLPFQAAQNKGNQQMALATTPTSLTDRIVGAARANRATYEEVEADTTATSQALTVVVLAALASGIGGAIGALMGSSAGNVVGIFVGSLITELLGWAIWSFAIFFVGTRLFKGQATYGEVLRTIGFAYSPGFLLILQFIPFLGGVIVLAVGLWRIWTSWVATKAALDLDTGNTIATIVVAVIAYFVVIMLVSSVLALVGLGTGAMMGVR